MDDALASAQRARMVEEQLVARGIADSRVLAAMRDVPRHEFVSPEQEGLAYADGALPIAHGQTLSQPYVVALMAEAAEVDARDCVLEIGAGSGYAAAVLSRLARRVFAVELDPELAARARERLAALGCANVELHAGDGWLGWPPGAPYDAIVVSAAADALPRALEAQLKPGGRLVIPIGSVSGVQSLWRIRRTGPDAFTREDLGEVQFVPLRRTSR